jgi:predicted nucleotidyltransferase
VPIVEQVVREISAVAPDTSVHVYGSVATGTARPPTSDVDILTVGLPGARARELAARWSEEWRESCRGVEVAASMPADVDGDGDEAYGLRVFLHRYCVLVAGPDHDRATSGFPGDRRAARGFNGDIARRAEQWRRDLAGPDPAELGRRVARKTLLAVAGLVSVHDATWTTDRELAVQRWSQVEPVLAGGLGELLGWASHHGAADRAAVARQLGTTVAAIVERFAAEIGLWGA